MTFFSFKDAIAALKQRVAEARKDFENAQFEINDIPRFQAEIFQNIQNLEAKQTELGCNTE